MNARVAVHGRFVRRRDDAVALALGAVVVAALIKRWKTRAPAVATVAPDHIDATAGELAALDEAVRRDR